MPPQDGGRTSVAGRDGAVVVDLTAAKAAAMALKLFEMRYARFFAISKVAFWSIDLDGNVTYSSSASDRFSIVTMRGDRIGQVALVHDDDRGHLLSTWRMARANSEPLDAEARICPVGGTEFRWTRICGFPDRDADGVFSGWYGTSEDIHERRLVAIALEESEARFKRLADDMPVVVWLCDTAGRTTYLSQRWYDLTGQTKEQALGLGWRRAVVAEDRPRIAPVRALMAAGKSFELDFRIACADGEPRWMLSTGRPRHAADGVIIGHVGTLTDINARKVAERELADTQMRLSRALDGTGVAVWEWDGATDTVTMIGDGLYTSGRAGAEADYRAGIHPDDRLRLSIAMNAYVSGACPILEVELRIRSEQHGWVWVLDRGTATMRDADQRATRIVGTLTDIDEAKRAEARLRWTVEHDALTGLANRTLFETRLGLALSTGACAIALFDIDDFKAVNDLYGHAAGDALLRVLAQRLRDFAAPHETVARLGGDEFTLIIPGCYDPAHALARLEVLCRSLAESFEHDGIVLNCRSSIGVAIAPAHGADASTLLKSADLAMYSAKQSRRGAVAMFEPALGVRTRRDALQTQAIRTALATDRVTPCYERVIRLRNGGVPGFEAIAHIVGDDAGMIDIHELGGAAGDIDLVARLGRTMLEQVLADLVRWRDAGCAPKFVSLNVSLSELRRPDYAEHVLGRLASYGIEPAQLRLEVVETVMNRGRDNDRSEATLAALGRGGVLAGLDNFGTGSATLAYLTRLALVSLKIDAQFVRGVDLPGSEQTVVRAMIGLAQSFGMRSVALGVETAAQAAKLRELGCTCAQGRYYGLGMDSEATFAWLRTACLR